MANALSKKRINKPCFYFVVNKIPLTTSDLDFALGNHALRPATYRLFTNLLPSQNIPYRIFKRYDNVCGLLREYSTRLCSEYLII